MKAKCIGCIGCSRRDVNSLLDLPRVYICRVGDCPPLLRLHYGRHTPARKLKISETRSSTLMYNPDLDEKTHNGLTIRAEAPAKNDSQRKDFLWESFFTGASARIVSPL